MNRSTLMAEYQDISQRLEYLVAHSSQMVFVTGEDMAIQKGFVEAFLGQQSQHANVAFLGAKKGKKQDYYRQQLAEQLYLESFNPRQSLVQSFAARVDKDTPVLIAVTNADLMGREMLKELWDLVLQNKFARSSEQINILVFGEQHWAEEVKSWLPTNNNDKPVLLTTQTLEYEEEQEIEGDLDEMIANRRKLFQERMKARSLNHYGTTPVLKAWWFRLLTACFFVVTFSAILIWQYFDVTSTAAREFANFLFQSELTEIAQAPENENAPAQQLNQNAAEQASENNVARDGTSRIDAQLEMAEPNPMPQSENARASESFAAALSALDGPTPPITEGQSQENVVTRSRPSPDQGMQEYVADISTEQLIALRTQAEQNAEHVADTRDVLQETAEIGPQQGPRESFDQMSQSLVQEAASMRTEQPLETEEVGAASEPVEEKLPDMALDAAINAALEVMEQIQTNSTQAAESATTAAITSEAETPAQMATDPITAGSATTQTEPTIEVNALPQESTPIEISDVSSPETDLLNEETILTGGEVEDYQVEDIVSEAQVIAQNAQLTDTVAALPVQQNEAVSSEAQTSVSEQTTEVADIAISEVDSQESTSDTSTQSIGPTYSYNESTLLNQSQGDYVLQITGVSTADLLSDYLTDNNLRQQVWVYQTQRYGGDWFVVLFNQSYSTLDDARRAVAQVTNLLPSAQPFVKSMGQVQQEINTGS